MNGFLSSGDLGDLIAQAASMKVAGKGILHLVDLPITKRFTPDRFNSIAPIFRAQDYIQEVKWYEPGDTITHDYTNFRTIYGYGENLATMNGRYLGIEVDTKQPWFKVPGEHKYNKNGPVLIARSVRYRTDSFPWHKILDFFGDDVKFISEWEDWRQFCNTMGREVELLPKVDFLEQAKRMLEARLVISNQTSLLWLAYALGVPIVSEQVEGIQDSVLNRSNVQCIIDNDVVIQDPKSWKILDTKTTPKKLKKTKYSKPLTIALPYMSRERAQWYTNLNYYKHLQDYSDYPAHIVCGHDTDENLIYRSAKQLFSKVDVSRDLTPISGWPEGPNHMFRFTADLLKGTCFFFLEADNIPTKEYWLDTIYEEYLHAGKPFMGAHVHGNVEGGHLNGSAIYPVGVQNYSAKLFEKTNHAFDLWAADEIRPHCNFSKLFQHEWHWRGVPPTFNSQGEVTHLIKEEAVIFHRNKDNSLAKLLRDRFSKNLKRTVRIKDIMQGMPYPGWHFKDEYGNYIIANSFNGLVERTAQVYRGQRRNTSEIKERVLEYMTKVAPYQMVEEIWI